MTLIGAQRVLQAIDRYANTLLQRGDDIPYELKTSIIREVIRTGSIDTAAMITAIDYHREVVTNTEQRYRIDTSNNPDVTYDGFVEFKGETRNWPGRYFYQRGIENAELERIFDSFADRSFVI